TAWIMLLLVGGGIALDRVLVTTVTKNFDDQLDYLLKAMIFSAELDQNGDVMLNRALADQRFLEYNSGAYWQISGRGHEAFPSRSLWDQKLKVDQQHSDTNVHVYDSRQLPGQLLRVAERDAVLPGSNVRWRFQVA
ncbi:histidine kinase, partial [Klebsiella pneumoniae]|uniref:sensor histidine kinase N-terminal domain-containing protein n=1 Tax=Klebsiella pneumoniae TaxID=573 RepID=UPI00148F1D02